jgi:hypothetical protein
MWNIHPIQIQALLYIHIHIHIHIYICIHICIYTEHVPKSGTGRGDQRRKKRKIASNNEVHNICVGTNTLKIVKQHRMGEKVRKCS